MTNNIFELIKKVNEYEQEYWRKSKNELRLFYSPRRIHPQASTTSNEK